MSLIAIRMTRYFRYRLAPSMISSEMPELLGMCDRIYVMNEGRMVAEMDAADATQEKIMAAILQSDKQL